MEHDEHEMLTGRQLLARAEQCTTRAAVVQGLVAPFVHRTLGYDIFDPAAVMPESTGATSDTGLKHPDARVEFAVRRAGVPRLLIAVHAPGEDAAEARRRLDQCLEQSAATLGAVTDGRRWRWIAENAGAGAVVYRETDMAAVDDADRELFALLSSAGWDPDAVGARAMQRHYEDAIAWRLGLELATPSDEFVTLLAGLVHEGRRTKHVVDCVRRAAAEGLRRAVRTAAGLGDPEPRTAPRRRLGKHMRIECEAPEWQAPAGKSQSGLMRAALDYLAAMPEAANAFAATRGIVARADELSGAVRADPTRYWTRDGWYASTIRRAEQKARLINALATRLGVPMKAVLEQVREPADRPDDADPGVAADDAGSHEPDAGAGPEDRGATAATAAAEPDATSGSQPQQDLPNHAGVDRDPPGEA